MKEVLHIGLIMRYGREWVGGTEYIKNIVLALVSLPKEERTTFKLSLICGQPIDPVYYSSVVSHLSNVFCLDLEEMFESRSQPRALLGKIRQKAATLLGHGKNQSFDAFLKKSNIDFVYPYSETERISCCHASWIYDFQHKYLSHLFSEHEIEKRDSVFLRVAQEDSTVVFSSQNAASDFHKFYPEAKPKSQVLSFRAHPDPSWYEGDPAEVQKEYTLPDRFFIVSNQFWTHKNHLVVFEALKLLQDHAVYPVIVCTGSLYDYRQPDYSSTVLQAIHKLGVARQVYLLGLTPRTAQIQLMRRSLAVIQPSMFEGWNTVVEEARCLAKPIILSDIPVHREQNPQRSIFFAPNSPETLKGILGEWWDRLTPGPDLEQESAARAKVLEEVSVFGYRFLEIVRRECNR